MQWIRTVAEMCQTGIEHQNKEIKSIQQHMTIVSDSTSKSSWWSEDTYNYIHNLYNVYRINCGCCRLIGMQACVIWWLDGDREC